MKNVFPTRRSSDLAPDAASPAPSPRRSTPPLSPTPHPLPSAGSPLPPQSRQTGSSTSSHSQDQHPSRPPSHAASHCNPALASLPPTARSEEHTSELQSLMRISYAVFCLKKKMYEKTSTQKHTTTHYNE